MNRVQKSKSSLIKQIARSSKWPMTYKEAKRELRKRERKVRRCTEFRMKNQKQIKPLASANSTPDGLRVDFPSIDEW